MSQEEQISEMNGMLHEMKPQLASCLEGVRSVEMRTRFLETRVEQHDVKIDRLLSDVDGIGKKIRQHMDRDRIHAAGEKRSNKWIAFLEFLAVLPQYWHVVLGGFIALVGIAGVVVRLIEHLQLEKFK